MRYCNYILVFITTVLFLNGCEFKKGQEHDDGLTSSYNKVLKKTDENIELLIDEKTPNVSSGIAFYENYKPWFFNLNQFTNEIQMFDLEDRMLHKRMKFEEVGNNGVGKIFGFYVHNLDSIFLFQHSKREIVLTDTSQVIKNRIKYEVPGQYTSAFVLTSYFASPPVIRNGKMIVKTHVDGDHKSISNEELSEKKLAYAIDLQNGKVELLPHNYPENYLSEGIRHFEQSFAASPEKIVYSLFADHNLYYADSETSKLTAKSAPSKYLKGDFENYPLSGNRLDSYKYFSASPHYESIMYDKYRNVYYRFCYPKVETEDEPKIMKLRLYPDSFSILILDKDLNIIGETVFDNEKYYPNNSFVSKDGLFISVNHVDNPRNIEDYLSFDLFELKDSN